MPIPRSPTAQVTWIPRQAETDFTGLLRGNQARVIPLVGAGGAGKTSLLHRFMSQCTTAKVPVLSLDMTKLQTTSALDALMQATTHGTDAFDACRKRLQESYETMSAILQSYGAHAGHAADLLQKTAGEESFGMIVDALIGSAKAAQTFWQRKENQQHRKLLRTPEESLLRALAEDFSKGGTLLIDTMEQAAHITLQTRLHSRDDGELVTVHNDQSQPVAFTEYLARLAFFLFDKPVLMVLAGRPPALRELGGLSQTYFAPTMEIPPFTETETEEYVRRQLPQLPPPEPEDIHRLHEITHGNPFLIERVTRLMADWQPPWRWETSQWEPLTDSYRKDDRHGLLLFVTQRLLTHVLQDDTAFWRLALPRHSVHQDMADLLFPPDEFPDAAGEERLAIYESKGLVYRGQEYAHFFLHDETRAALQAWAEHRRVWLDDRAGSLHTTLGDLFANAAGWPESYPDPVTRIESNGNPLLLEAAYHRVMANTLLESAHQRDRKQFWKQLSVSIRMTNATKLQAAESISDQSTSAIDSLLQELAEESIALEKLLSPDALAWLQSHSQSGALPIDWVWNRNFLQKAILMFPQEPGLLMLLAEFLQKSAPGEADALFQRAIASSPEDVGNLASYAFFLSDLRNRHDDAEEIYRRAIKIDPKNANILGDYAIFLNHVRRRHDDAESLYQRAIGADPNHANHLGNYAAFLASVRRRNDEAEALYIRAIEANPSHANNLGNYAVFLHNIRQRHDEAEALYIRAIEANPNHANNLGSYALFLHNIRQRHDEAEAFYNRAIEIDPSHANNLANHASFLYLIRQNHNEAERAFKHAIETNPNHENSLVFFAHYLATVRQKHDDAEAYFRRALGAETVSAYSVFLFAEFLSDVRQLYGEAEPLYLRAAEQHPSSAAIIGTTASFLHTKRKDYSRAEAFYRQALALVPNEANCLGNLAQLVLARSKPEEGRALVDRAFAAEPPPPLRLELWFYRYAHFPQMYPEASETIETLLTQGVRSPGWDLSITLAQAGRDGHPDLNRLESLAARLAEEVPATTPDVSDAVATRSD